MYVYVCMCIYIHLDRGAGKQDALSQAQVREAEYIYKLILVKKRYTYKPISIVHLYISLLYTWTGVPVSSTRWAERSFESRT